MKSNTLKYTTAVSLLTGNSAWALSISNIKIISNTVNSRKLTKKHLATTTKEKTDLSAYLKH